MTSLSAHLRQPGSHAGLPFRADCPVCRDERLCGTVATGPIVPRRAQASLAAALLAVSGAAPGIAAAAAGPHQAAAQGAGIPDGDEADPNFDPGGNDPLNDRVQDPAGQVPGGGDQDDDSGGPPVEQEPSQDPYVDELNRDAPEPANQPPSQEEEVTPSPAPLPTPPPAAAPDEAPPVAVPAPPIAESEPKPAPKTPDPDGEQPRGGQDRVQPPDTEPTGSPAPPAAAPPSAPAPTSSPSANTASAQTQQQGAVDRQLARGSVHVVRPGESLWSIASDQLVPRASPAEIARFVNRLWELNAERISTGDPDLIIVGTHLVLP